ncbi:hypothetical protein DL93DRAFT_2156454 [Clavulina sp. PMI_390]|nr:hypothetical protein DL93DRAFT_2156454 [Clavulina sp. PMI_390]
MLPRLFLGTSWPPAERMYPRGALFPSLQHIGMWETYYDYPDDLRAMFIALLDSYPSVCLVYQEGNTWPKDDLFWTTLKGQFGDRLVAPAFSGPGKVLCELKISFSNMISNRLYPTKVERKKKRRRGEKIDSSKQKAKERKMRTRKMKLANGPEWEVRRKLKRWYHPSEHPAKSESEDGATTSTALTSVASPSTITATATTAATPTPVTTTTNSNVEEGAQTEDLQSTATQLPPLAPQAGTPAAVTTKKRRNKTNRRARKRRQAKLMRKALPDGSSITPLSTTHQTSLPSDLHSSHSGNALISNVPGTSSVQMSRSSSPTQLDLSSNSTLLPTSPLQSFTQILPSNLITPNGEVMSGTASPPPTAIDDTNTVLAPPHVPDSSHPPQLRALAVRAQSASLIPKTSPPTSLDNLDDEVEDDGEDESEEDDGSEDDIDANEEEEAAELGIANRPHSGPSASYYDPCTDRGDSYRAPPMLRRVKI